MLDEGGEVLVEAGKASDQRLCGRDGAILTDGLGSRGYPGLSFGTLISVSRPGPEGPSRTDFRPCTSSINLMDS